MPAAINEVLWSVGITTYNAVYARIGTDAIAAVNINATIEELMFVLFIGLGNACAVMVGNKIGAGGKDMAFEYGRRFLILGVVMAVLGGIVVLSIRSFVIGLYPLSSSGVNNLYGLMTVYAFSNWLRVFNFMLFIGALRAGGDTRYSMFTELFSIWVVGVPVALIGGFVLDLPVYGVYALGCHGGEAFHLENAIFFVQQTTDQFGCLRVSDFDRAGSYPLSSWSSVRLTGDDLYAAVIFDALDLPRTGNGADIESLVIPGEPDRGLDARTVPAECFKI
jgi:Na+-driven multidrug efflux pump